VFCQVAGSSNFHNFFYMKTDSPFGLPEINHAFTK
jgi:hypothetical protein